MNDLATKHRWIIVTGCTLAFGMTFIDQTALNVALPSMQQDLHLSSSGLHWVVNAYLLVLAVLLILGGNLGDRIGKKQIFLLGTFLFGLSSLCCALAPNGMALIASRVLQGIGGALMIPNGTAISLSLFPDNMRGRVMGTMMSFMSLFLILGPFVGGALTQYLSWRYVFWLNIPVALSSILITTRFCPILAANRERKIDWYGFVMLTASIFFIVFALMQGADDGWVSTEIIGSFVLGTLLMAVFIRHGLQYPHPFVELKLFKSGIFNRAVFIYAGTQFIFMSNVFMPIFMQRVLGFTPMMAGLLSIISMMPIMLLARFAGGLRDRYGPRLPMSIGLVALTTGVIWLAATLHTHNIYIIFPGTFGFALAGPFVFGNANTAALTSVPQHYRSTASGVSACCRQIGATLGMAVIAAVITDVGGTQLSAASMSHLGIQDHAYTFGLSAALALTAVIALFCLLLARGLPTAVSTHTKIAI